MPMHRLGLIVVYNGIDIMQMWHFVKITIKTWLTLTLVPYLHDWLDVPSTTMPTNFGPSKAFIKCLYSTFSDPNLAVQAQLEKQFGIKYHQAIDQVIWPMTTCQPDLAQSVVKLTQHSATPANVHYWDVKSVLRYVVATLDEGIYFWYTVPHMDLPEDQMPPIHSTPHDSKLANCPVDTPMILSNSMNSGWGSFADSSTEAEFMMMHNAGWMSLYLCSLCCDLGAPQMQLLFCMMTMMGPLPW
ncbi:hypothetical protein ACHAW6_007767 [Cyclotella cf. meneghiniana]